MKWILQRQQFKTEQITQHWELILWWDIKIKDEKTTEYDI
jgi:hypothetical protein